MRHAGCRGLAAVLTAGLLTLVAGRALADAVILKDGSRLEGKVKVQELGKWVVIELPNGTQKTVMWEDLKEVEVSAPTETPEPPKATPDAAPPATSEPKKPKHKKKLDKTEFGGEATTDGVSAGMVHDCGEGEPACHEEATVQIKGGDVKASYDAVEDCATEAGEVCTKTTSANAGKDGLSLKISKESARRVTGPKTGATQFGLLANFLYATGDMLTMQGFTAGLDVRFLTGPQFPGEKGGSWLGFFLAPSAQFSYTKTEIETPETCVGSYCNPASTSSSNSSALMANATAGIQWMKFGAMDQKTLQQSGFGVAIGGQVGAYIPLSEGDATKTYGAALNLLLPKYNPGTGAFTSEQLNIFILPTDKLFFLLIGLQRSWG